MREILAGLLWLACCALAMPCWAGRPVRVYEVALRGGQTPAALQEAMREALVRATGQRQAGDDPALASLVSGAANYVKGYVPGSHGESQVVFDGAAVEQAITAAGRGVWPSDRPFTLVVLSPPPPRAVEDAARSALEQAATVRGLPISLVPLAIADASSNDLGRDAVMQMAQRYGADAVLVGRGDPSAANVPLQWTLYTDFGSQSFTGSLSGGIDWAADQFAPGQDGSLAQAEMRAVIEVRGLTSLNDYAVVERMLEGMPGSRRANLLEADGTSAAFDVTVRGGAESIDRMLTGSGRFVREGTTRGRPSYEYRPQ